MQDNTNDYTLDASASLTDLGQVIAQRKKLNIPQEEVAKACGLTKQRWNQIEKAYQDDPRTDRAFSFQEMRKLNLLLHFDESEVLSAEDEPVIFPERKIADSLFDTAIKRDPFLTCLVLRRICGSSEEDLLLLQQTVSVLIEEDIPYEYDSLLIFYAAMRKHIMRAVYRLLPNEEALDDLILSAKKTMKAESNLAAASTDTASGSELTAAKEAMRLRRYASNAIMDSLMCSIRNDVRPVIEQQLEQKIGLDCAEIPKK